MRIFGSDIVNQGSPEWFELRRGLPTASGMDRILTPSGKPSAQAEGYMAELAADVAELSPTWFTERMNKPPNEAMRRGTETEPQTRSHFEFEKDCSVIQVGGCLSDCGRYWVSPDGLCVSDSGALCAGLELKSPLLKTHAGYLLKGILPADYRPQCHDQLLITGLPVVYFVSHAPGLEVLIVEVRPDEYTEKLREAKEDFWVRYMEVLARLHLRERFDQQRSATLAHYPDTEVI